MEGPWSPAGPWRPRGVVSIASGSRKFGGKLRTHFFLTRPPPGSADSAVGTSCGCLNGFCGNAASGAVSIASRCRIFWGKIADAHYFLTRPPPRISGPGQPTPRQELLAAVLMAFAATPSAPPFPLPPDPENLGGKFRAKNFWPGSADSAVIRNFLRLP